MGATRNERAFIAGNRVGKSYAIGYEATLHLIGWYPDWWTGRRFDRPVKIWASGEDAKAVRESFQPKLIGTMEEPGTGLIPKANLVNVFARSGVTGAADFAEVKHASGGTSRLVFKSYDQGSESFASSEVDIILLDEEPPMDIYTEALTRTMSTVPGTPNGILMAAFTPLEGLSDTVKQFLPGGQYPATEEIRDRAWGTSKWVVKASWNDVPHLSDENKRAMISAYLPHERDARTRGDPQLGAGAIYPIPESEIVVDDFPLPPHYRYSYGMDVGWNRTAVIWAARDTATDTVYLYSEHYRAHAEPSTHAASIRARGEWMQGAIDPAARGRSATDGDQLLGMYRDLGLLLTKANNGVDSGLLAVYQRLVEGRLKVFRSCQNWLMEYRTYRRTKKGDVLKEDDHLMDATRYLIVSGLELGSFKPVTEWEIGKPRGQHRSDFDPFESMRGGAVAAPEYNPFAGL